VSRILNVPYRSQWDVDANKSTTDCGPACLAMVLSYYGHQVSINDLFAASGVEPGQYVGFGQLQAIARDYGVTFKYGANHSLNDLKRWIDEGKPAIALVKYSHWSQIEPGVSTQDGFNGPHFVLVVGYGDGNIYINDPNYWPPRRQEGHKKVWSEVLFNLAWSNVRTSNAPNPNNAVIVPTSGKMEEITPEVEGAARGVTYTVQPGDTWSGLAARFYGDQSRYPEILSFNHLGIGAPLYVGQKLRIPLTEEGEEEMPPEQPVILGHGATQSVEVDLIRRLKNKEVGAGKLASNADPETVLRAFVDQIKSAGTPEAMEYIVQPGDTWAGIAGKFLHDQMRYRDIMAFNNLPPGAPLYAGQKLLIPTP